MDPIVVGTKEGWRWYLCGWQMFRKSPWILIGQVVVLLIIALLLNVIPVIGGLALALITPVLAGGWYYTLRELEGGEPVTLAHLFEGFRNKQWTRPLIVLGAAILAAEIVLGLTTVSVLGFGFLMHPTAVQTGAASLTLSIGGIISLALALTLTAAVFAAMFYAIPLVIFGSLTPISAIKNSLWAGIRNWRPLLLFGLVYIVLAIVAAIPLGLGFLVLIPLSVCAAYCSYKAVYESPGQP